MGSIPNGLALLNQPGTGLLANLPVRLSATTLQAANPQELVDLTSSAISLQQAERLFSLTPAAPPLRPAPLPPAASAPAGIAAADLAPAGPPQQAAIANPSIQQQIVQALFYPAADVIGGTTNLTG